MTSLSVKPPLTPKPSLNNSSEGVYKDMGGEQHNNDDTSTNTETILTDYTIEPSDETFSKVIPVQIALEKNFSWAAMEDTSKKVGELKQLAPTVYHANKVIL